MSHRDRKKVPLCIVKCDAYIMDKRKMISSLETGPLDFPQANKNLILRLTVVFIH